MEILPVGPGFAAELRGVTLADIAADDAAYKERAPRSRSIQSLSFAARM